MIEIVAKDGTVFRVFGHEAVTESTQNTAGTKAWNAEIEKLKATPKGGK